MGDNPFKVKIALKRKRLPSSPINIRIQATKAEDINEEEAKKLLPGGKTNIRTPRGARGYYK